MIFAELTHDRPYGEVHGELVEWIRRHFEQVEAGLQGDSWIWIHDDGHKVAVDTFSAMRHQVKSDVSGPLVQRVIEVLERRYPIHIEPSPRDE